MSGDVDTFELINPIDLEMLFLEDFGGNKNTFVLELSTQYRADKLLEFLAVHTV